MKEKLKYWVWLSSIPGIGARKSARLIELFGEPEKIWFLPEEQLRKTTFLNETNIRQIVDKKHRSEAQRHMEMIFQKNISVITIKDESYPFYLKNIHDPPIALYIKGTLYKDEKSVAVVGARRATPYGLEIAEKLSFELARHGITVISGMARGIDSHAHNGTLKAGGRTIAVLGCGLDKPYPAENKLLMEKITEHGAVISEYVPGTPPLPGNFPARNRIISGLSHGVVVIEAGEKSGSLITADFALEQGRDVFAVPGNVGNSSSKGSNRLIKEGAKLVTCAKDILEELNIPNLCSSKQDSSDRDIKMQKVYEKLNENEKIIWSCLEAEALHIDLIAKKSGLSIQAVNSILVMMELKGLVEPLPGKLFKLAGY